MEKVKCTNEQFDDIARRFLNKEITRGEAIKLSGYKVAWFSTKLSIYRQRNGLAKKHEKHNNTRVGKEKKLTNEFQKFLCNCGESPTAYGIPLKDYNVLKDMFINNNTSPIPKIQRIGAVHEFEENKRQMRFTNKGGPNNAKKCVVIFPDGKELKFGSLLKAVEHCDITTYTTASHNLKQKGYYTKQGITFKYDDGDKNNG